MDSAKPKIEVCTGPNCGQRLYVKLSQSLKDEALGGLVEVTREACMGLCRLAPDSTPTYKIPETTNIPTGVRSARLGINAAINRFVAAVVTGVRRAAANQTPAFKAKDEEVA